MWGQANGGQIIHGSSIPARLVGNIVVEMSGQDCDEEGLFHLLNRAMNKEARVLITSRTGPRGWAVQLGDLASRLRSLDLVYIDEPDDDVLGCILQKLCKDRLIRPSSKLIHYLVDRMERSSEGALKLVELLNARSLETTRPVNMKLAREIMAELDQTPELLSLMRKEPE